jgi:serine/threonine protein phosphatase PrpC
MDGLQMEQAGQTGEKSALQRTQATTYAESGSQVTCGPISLIYEARSDCGQDRSKNEDALILAPSSGLFGVCDGMGGYAAGEIASDIASTTLVNCLDVPGSQPAITLETGILEADRRIMADQEDCPVHCGMGTTLTALWIGQDRSPLAWIGHVGDSRIYRYRYGVLSQLTVDDIFREDRR